MKISPSPQCCGTQNPPEAHRTLGTSGCTRGDSDPRPGGAAELGLSMSLKHPEIGWVTIMISTQWSRSRGFIPEIGDISQKHCEPPGFGLVDSKEYQLVVYSEGHTACQAIQSLCKVIEKRSAADPPRNPWGLHHVAPLNLIQLLVKIPTFRDGQLFEITFEAGSGPRLPSPILGL